MPIRRKPLPFLSPAARQAGVLLHVTSLPGPFGIGDLGPAAYAWVDQLAAAHQSWWQVLPLGPTAQNHAPYNCYSAFAGNPLLISPEALVADGFLDRSDLKPLPGRADRVNYPAVERAKTRLLRQAWANFQNGAGRRWRAAFEAFVALSVDWLDDFAMFATLRAAHPGAPWTQWPRPIARRDPTALMRVRTQCADEIAYHQFVQFLFDLQLQRLRTHAHATGVGLLGDIPIFVSANSADVWANPHLFQLDRTGNPRAVAGVPPDVFSLTGQRWNNPLYDWPALQRTGYAWWIARVKRSLAQADAVRLDHFRGFDAYWRIPIAAPTAATGRWIDGPGMALFDTLRNEIGALPMVVEDLGTITERVTHLRDTLGLAGMRVLQFGIGEVSDSIHLPHRFVRNCAAYPGTHDNDTAIGWYRKLSARERRHFIDYAGSASAADDPAWTLIRMAWASVAALAITPMQDVLSLPSSARMNTPGTDYGNWCWRMSDTRAIEKGMERLGKMTCVYARV